MHTVDLLEECVGIAQQLGYRVRREWLGGVGGGACEFGGRRWIFIDLGLNAAEQLQQAANALRQDPQLHQLRLSAPLTHILHGRRAA